MIINGMNVEFETLVQVVVVLSAMATAITIAVKFIWPFFQRLDDFVEDWFGTKGRPGHEKTPGIVERIKEIEKHAKSADYHSKTNGGGSAYDALNSKIDILLKWISESQEDRKRLWQAIERIKDEENE